MISRHKFSRTIASSSPPCLSGCANRAACLNLRVNSRLQSCLSSHGFHVQEVKALLQDRLAGLAVKEMGHRPFGCRATHA